MPIIVASLRLGVKIRRQRSEDATLRAQLGATFSMATHCEPTFGVLAALASISIVSHRAGRKSAAQSRPEDGREIRG